MATNPFFRYDEKSEQNLYEELVIEALAFFGQDVYYLPRKLVTEEKILGDEIPSRFSSAYKIEMYIETVEGFGGEGDLFQRFGIEIRDQATFVMARRRWRETIANFANDIGPQDEPGEGDLIYLPLSKSLFQIMRVEKEDPFYQLSNLPTYKLQCELFEYSDEELETGVADIDQIVTFGYELELQLDSDSDAAGVFLPGSTVNQTLSSGTILSGDISAYNKIAQKLSIVHMRASDGKYNLFTLGGTISDSDTGATKIIRGVNENLGDHGYMNKVFDSDVTWLNFDETNPFGGPI